MNPRAIPSPLRSTLVKSIVGITGGALVAQFVLIVANAVVARLVTPSQFALFAVSSAIAGILSAGLVASYPSIIPIASSEAQSSRLAWLTLTITAFLLLASLAGVEVWFWVLDKGPILGLNHGLALLTLASAGAVAVWTLARALLVRHRKFRALATTSVWGNVVQSLAQIAASIAGFGAAGLVGGYLLGRLINAGQMLHRKGPGRRPSAIRMRVEARRWGRLPVQLTVPILINQVTVWAVTPIVAGFYGDSFAGWFALGFRVLVIPLTLLGQSIATVIFPETAGRHAIGEDSSPVLVTTARSLLALGIPLFGTVILLGPELFSLIFGPSWRTAGVIASILAPWMALGLASSAISSFATVRQRFGGILAIGLVEGTLRVGALFIGHTNQDPFLGIVLYSLVGALIAVAWVVWVLHEAATSRFEIRRTLLTPILSLVAVCVVALLARSNLSESQYLAVGSGTALILLTWAGVEGRRMILRR